MTSFEKETYDEIQAGLLNSSCDPMVAVALALRLAAEFAVSEGVISDDPSSDGEHSFIEMAKKAWAARENRREEEPLRLPVPGWPPRDDAHHSAVHAGSHGGCVGSRPEAALKLTPGIRFVASYQGSPAIWETKEREKGGWLCAIPATSGMENDVGVMQVFSDDMIQKAEKLR